MSVMQWFFLFSANLRFPLTISIVKAWNYCNLIFLIIIIEKRVFTEAEIFTYTSLGQTARYTRCRHSEMCRIVNSILHIYYIFNSL